MSADILGSWEYARAQWELDVCTLGHIARESGLKMGEIRDRAKKEGWVKSKDGRQRIREAVKESTEKSYGLLIEEQKDRIVSVTAYMQSKVLTEHRTDIKAARAITYALFCDLEEMSRGREAFENLGEVLRVGDTDRLNDAYKRVLSIPDRSATLNSLVNALKTLIQLERQAYDIQGPIEDPEASRPATEVVRGLDKIMEKFDAVLAMQVPLPDVVDVTPTNQRAVTLSPV